MPKEKLKARKSSEYQAIGKLLEDMYMANTDFRAKVLWFSFLRGLFYGLGIFIAGTLVVGVIIWILGLFDSIPLIGPLIEKIINNLDSSPKL